MSDIYDVDYFIRKFEAIPEEKIGVGMIENCALCHLGVHRYLESEITSEVEAFAALLRPLVKPRYAAETPTQFEIIYTVNDGNRGCDSLGATPRARILKALNKIKRKVAK